MSKKLGIVLVGLIILTAAGGCSKKGPTPEDLAAIAALEAQEKELQAKAAELEAELAKVKAAAAKPNATPEEKAKAAELEKEKEEADAALAAAEEEVEQKKGGHKGGGNKGGNFSGGNKGGNSGGGNKGGNSGGGNKGGNSGGGNQTVSTEDDATPDETPVPATLTAEEAKGMTGDVVIPTGVVTIAEKAFSGAKLTSVVIPSGVTTIGKEAFKNNQLTSVAFPSSVTTIESEAFNRNNKLASVTFAKEGVSIGQRAFDGGLRNVYEKEGAGTYLKGDDDNWTKN